METAIVNVERIETAKKKRKFENVLPSIAGRDPAPGRPTMKIIRRSLPDRTETAINQAETDTKKIPIDAAIGAVLAPEIAIVRTPIHVIATGIIENEILILTIRKIKNSHTIYCPACVRCVRHTIRFFKIKIIHNSIASL